MHHVCTNSKKYLFYMCFVIYEYFMNIFIKASDQRAVKQTDCRTNRRSNRRAVGPTGRQNLFRRTIGPSNQRAVVPTGCRSNYHRANGLSDQRFVKPARMFVGPLSRLTIGPLYGCRTNGPSDHRSSEQRAVRQMGHRVKETPPIKRFTKVEENVVSIRC